MQKYTQRMGPNAPPCTHTHMLSEAPWEKKSTNHILSPPPPSTLPRRMARGGERNKSLLGNVSLLYRSLRSFPPLLSTPSLSLPSFCYFRRVSAIQFNWVGVYIREDHYLCLPGLGCHWLWGGYRMRWCSHPGGTASLLAASQSQLECRQTGWQWHTMAYNHPQQCQAIMLASILHPHYTHAVQRAERGTGIDRFQSK